MWYLNGDCWQEGFDVSVLVMDWVTMEYDDANTGRWDGAIYHEINITKNHFFKNESEKGRWGKAPRGQKGQYEACGVGLWIYTVDVRTVVSGSQLQALWSVV